jgi:hypothetical protein
MKKILLSVYLILCFSSSFAQDLIVTDSGDSINCEISEINSKKVYFTTKSNNKIRSTLLPVDQVKHLQFYFYKAKNPAHEIVVNKEFQKWRFAINAGLGKQTAKVGNYVTDDFKKYTKDLRSGYQINGDITYFVSEPIGFGLKYQLYKTKNQMSNIYISWNNGIAKGGNMSDNISVTFIGPTLYTRFFNSKRNNALLLGLSAGYLGYVDKALAVNKYIQKGSTAGFVCDIGYDIGVCKNMAIGFNISFLVGHLKESIFDDWFPGQIFQLDENNRVGLGRFDFSLGIRFNTSK